MLLPLSGSICVLYYDVTIPGENFDFKVPGLNYIWSLGTIVESFPVRSSAIHLCLKPETGNLAIKNSILVTALKVKTSYHKARTLIHYGTDMELQYYLRSHGIPTQSFPVDLDGNVRKDILNTWLHNHKEEIQSQGQPGDYFSDLNSTLLQEESRKSSENDDGQGTEGKQATFAAINQGSARGISEDGDIKRPPGEPAKQDILLGRGWKIQNREGNKWFRSFLVAHCDEYDGAPRLEKRKVAGSYVNQLRGQGIRFWKEESEGVWVEATMEEAENKVSQMFRTLRKTTKETASWYDARTNV